VKIRYSLGVVALVVACGGSSKHETSSGGNSGSSGDSSGASGTGGNGKGGSGATTSKGGTSGTGVGGGNGAAPGAGGDLPGGGGAAGSVPSGGGTGAFPGGGGDFGGLPGTGAAGSGTFGQICNEDGCFLGDPNVMPIDPLGPIHCGGEECAKGEACCNSSGKCFNPMDDSEACPRPPADDDPEGRRTCTSSAHCDELFYCALDYNQLCGGVGHCQPISNCGSCGGGGDGPNPCRLCGCDGNTYPNVQTACLAGTSIAYQGAGCGETIQEGGAAGASGAGGSSNSPPHVVTPCGTNDDCTVDGEECCTITNRCYPTSDPGQCAQPPEGTRFPCTSNAQCRQYEMCAGEGSCGSPGGCVSVDEGQCGIVYKLVCGCDGTTYTSADCARLSGVRVKSEGECPAD